MKMSRVQFVIRGLRLREMEMNVKRKEDDVKKAGDKYRTAKEEMLVRHD